VRWGRRGTYRQNDQVWLAAFFAALDRLLHLAQSVLQVRLLVPAVSWLRDLA
jgi:hypothetical protein